MAETYLEKLNKLTFSVHHTPNAKDGYQYQVHLIGNSGTLDNITHERKTKDIIGYGKTMEEAAKQAWEAKFGNKEEINEREKMSASDDENGQPLGGGLIVAWLCGKELGDLTAK